MDNILLSMYEEENTWHFQKWGKRRKGKLLGNGDSLTLSVNAASQGEDLPIREAEIYCEAGRDSRLTVLDPYRFRLSTRDGKTSASYGASIVVLQMFKKRRTAHKVSNIRCNIPQLNMWLGIDKTNFDYQSKSLKDSTNTTIDIPLYEMRLDLEVGLDVNARKDELVIQNSNSACLRFNAPRDYWYAIYEIRKLESLVNFSFTAPHYATEFSSFAAATGNTGLGTAKYIFSKSYDGNETREYKDTHRWSLLFRYDKLSNGPSVVARWFEIYEELAPIIENLTMFKTSETTENTKFLTYLNSIELLHSQFLDRPKMSQSEFDKLKSRLRVAINPSDFETIAGLIGMANSLSLKQRLQDIKNLAVMYGCVDIPESEIDKIVHTRRKFVHNSKMSGVSTLQIHEVSRVNRILGQYLKAVILHTIGVTEKDLKDIVSTGFQFKDFYSDGL